MNQVPHLQDIGFPVVTAAAALGTTGLGSIVGKLLFGWLCDRILAKYAWSISNKDLECTYFVYEIIRAIKWAAKRRRLSPKEIEGIFYSNAKGLLK